MYSALRISRDITLVLFVMVGLTGFSSCSQSLEAVCASRLPEFERETASAKSQLSQGRGLASQESATARPGHKVKKEPSREWQAWAEARLMESQSYMDVLDGESNPSEAQRQLHRALSDISNELVLFHGYATLSDGPKMSESLGRIRLHSEKARSIACTRN